MATTSFERELIRQRKALTRIDRRTEAHLIGEYRELYKRLDWQLRNVTEAIGQARATGRAPNVSWLVRQTHYEQLMLDVERETTRFAFTAAQRIANAQSDAISQVDGHMRTLIESALSPAPAAALAEVSLRFGGLPSGAFERLVGNASNGRPLGRLLHQISPQTTRKAARALQQGIALGLHPREVARDFRAATGATLKRSLLISRTEMMRAYREANREAYMASEVVKGWTWIAALDDRTCPACLFMHGTEHAADESLDGHPRCFISDTVVSGPRNTGSTSRWFEGDVVDIDLADGNRLTCTPNHPILTTEGWVAAGLLNEGGHVVSRSGGEWVSAVVHPDDYQVPSRIEDVARATGGKGRVCARSVPTATEDFHGDGGGSNVSVVRTDRLLRDSFNASLTQPHSHEHFGGANVGRLFLAGLGNLLPMFDGLLAAPNGGLGGLGIASVLFGGTLCRRHTVGLGLSTEDNAGLHQGSADNVPGYPLPSRESVHRFAGDVAPNEIVSVRKRDFTGMVHNLETPTGWYIANGVIVHNCRCDQAPITKSWAELGFPGIPDTRPQITPGTEVFDRLGEEAQRKIVGPGALDALQRGEIVKQDLIARPRSREWGTMRRTSSLKDAKARASQRAASAEARAKAG